MGTQIGKHSYRVYTVAECGLLALISEGCAPVSVTAPNYLDARLPNRLCAPIIATCTYKQVVLSNLTFLLGFLLPQDDNNNEEY